MIVSIEGTDRTRLIESSSLTITRVLTSQPDTAHFTIRKFGSRTYAPSVNEEVIITDDDATKIFAGHIIEVEEDYRAVDDISYLVKCVDYTRFMDARLIVAAYENQTVAQIIQDFKDSYFPNSVTINNVNVNTLIKYIAFNYEYPSDALRQLAEVTGSDWYIDYDKDINFFHQKSIPAAFNLTDTSGNYVYESLIIRRDLSQLRNIIYVRGGEYLANTITAAYEADGIRRNFFLPHKFSNLVVTVTGQEKNIGTDPIDLETEYDALHNFSEKVIKFREDRKPTAGSEVRISGNPNIPIITKVRDTDSVETFTAREHLIIDKSIKSKEGARQRAIAELLSFKSTISEGEFKTYTGSLIPGQKINVQSTNRGIDEDFIINRVEIRLFATSAADKTNQLVYKVSLITTKTFDHIQLLQKLLNEKKKEIVIDDNEILDEVEAIDEEMTISEVVTASIQHEPLTETMSLSEVVTGDLDYGEVYVFGPWTSGREEDLIVGKKRQFLFDGSPLG